MQITVAGKQIDLSDALNEHVWAAIHEIADKYFENILKAQVTFSRTRTFFACVVNLHVKHNLQLRGEGEAATAAMAFDIALDHAGKRLRRVRRKVNDHARDYAVRNWQPAELNVSPAEMQEPDEEEIINGVEVQFGFATLIAERLECQALTVREAAMQLDQEKLETLMFRNINSREINVVYRRKDGNIGWIESADKQMA